MPLTDFIKRCAHATMRRANLGWRIMLLVDICWPIFLGDVQCFCRLKLMGQGKAWCRLTIVCNVRVMFKFRGWRQLSDVQNPRSTRAVNADDSWWWCVRQGRYGNANPNDYWMMCTVNRRCGRSMLNRYTYTTSDLIVYDLGRLDNASCHWPMSLSWSRYTLAYDVSY